ncbi:autophagy-related protein 13-domain-containing protein [Tirmania nivea]|nr:autophagy-related protein 13-domain-containing protein [Tirmania nivea]
MGPGRVPVGGLNGGYGGQHGSPATPNSRPTSTYRGYTGLSTSNQESGFGGGGGGGRGGGGADDGGREGVGGGGGAGGDDSAFRERVNQVVQNFYLKAAMIIIQQRIPVAPLYASRTGSKKVNVWFNLDLDDTDAFREELSLWKNVDVYRHRPPPLVIETYIDVKELTANQTLVLLDEQGKRWDVDTAISNKMDVVSGSGKAGKINEVKPDVVLERWVVDLRPRNGDIALPQLPVAYKHAVFIFRSLYTYAGLMPAQKLLKRLTKVTVHQNALKVCCRVKVGEGPSTRWDGLNLPLIDGESQVVGDYTFGMVDTPAGELHINVSYRKHFDFRVDDFEELLSSHFINLDERYFQPSLNSHQRTASQPQSLGRRDTSSLQSVILNASLRQEPQQYGGHIPLYSQGAGMNSSPSSAPRGQQVGGPSLSSSPAEHTYMNLRPVQGSKSSLRGIGEGITRRPSVSFMQPFKSPSLSNSPSADAIPPSPRTSVTRISSTTAPIAARTRPAISPVIPKSTPSYDAPGPLGISPSPRPPSIGRYSSSFGARKPRPATGHMRADDEISSGKGSYSSSIQRPGSAMFNEQGSKPNEDDKVVDFLKLLDFKQPLKMFSQGDSSKKMTTALVKFQQMKDSHNALSDSMSQSLLLQKSGSSSTPGKQSSTMQPLPASSYSPSSSPGNPLSSYTSFTPAVPSRLSAGQTAVCSSKHKQAQEQDRFAPNQSSSTVAGRGDDQSVATSPLDIPALSPRPFHGSGGPSSYQPDRYDVPRIFKGPVYGPTSASGVLSLSKLDELRLASEEALPGRSITRDDGDVHREAREDERGVSRGGSTGGLTGSSSSLRGRVHRGSGRGTTYTPPGGSQTYLNRDQADSVGSDRPSLTGRRTPSYPRAGEEEDLLFAMSDMSTARRSMENDRAGDPHDVIRGGDSAPPANPQRFSRGPPGGGSSGSGPTGKINRW